jgi:hypothetical protein
VTKVTSEELERLQRQDEKLKERYKKQNDHTNKIYDRLNFTVPAGRKADIEAAAKSAGKTLNAFLRDTVLDVVESKSDFSSIKAPFED